MTIAATKCQENYNQSAARFIKSVVFFDDLAEYGDADQAPKSATRANISEEVFGPVVSGIIAPKAPPEVEKLSQDADQIGAIATLDAKKLTDAFADKGIICSVVKPTDPNDAKIIEQIVKIADAADILVLDWFLRETDYQVTLYALKRLIEIDASTQPRVRLICIHSSARQAEILKELMSLMGAGSQLGNRPVFQKGKLRIHVMSKQSSANPKYFVTPDQLPAQIITSFSQLAGGFLSSAALNAVAAVREKTHALLAKFEADLDGAYIAHRSLVPDPEDSELFFEELFGGQISTLLATESIGKKVGIEQAIDWIDEQKITEKNSTSIKELAGCYSDKKMDDIRENHSHLYADSGKSKSNIADKEIAESVGKVLHGTASANGRLSVLSGVQVDCFDIKAPSLWLPRLSLGSIVLGKDGRYLFCIQPLCDSVRISNRGSNFTFLYLVKAEITVFDICVRNPAGEGFIYLKVDSKPSNIVNLLFIPTANRSYIEGTRANNKIVFDSAPEVEGEGRFEWLANVRQSKAQRLVSSVAHRLQTLGIDEYEWMRLRLSESR